MSEAHQDLDKCLVTLFAQLRINDNFDSFCHFGYLRSRCGDNRDFLNYKIYHSTYFFQILNKFLLKLEKHSKQVLKMAFLQENVSNI